MDCLAWLIGIEYVEKDNIIFLGSNTQTVLVLPSSGVDKDIENIFKNVTVKQIDDKVIVVGSERDVARVKQAYEKVLNRAYTLVHLYAIEVSYDNEVLLGIDIDKAIKYSFNWESLATYQYNPIQNLVMSIEASLEADATSLKVSSVIDTDIGLVSGKQLFFQIGQDDDRPIYSESSYGEQSRVVTGYNTQRTGIILKMKAYFNTFDWYIDFMIENSKAESDLKKTLTSLQTVVKLSKNKPVRVIAQMDLGSESMSYKKGIPILCEIPYIGYLFKVTTERRIKRKLFFILQLKDDPESITIPRHYNFDSFIDLQNTISNGVSKGINYVIDYLFK